MSEREELYREYCAYMCGSTVFKDELFEKIWQAARRTVSGEEADEALGLATALEQQRALHIVLAVRKQGFSKSESGIPTQAESVFDLACEEIEHRLRTEVWELGGIAAPIPATELKKDTK